MKSVTNNALGPRAVFGTLEGKKEPESILLLPGETRDFAPVGGDVFDALVKGGELKVGRAGERPETEAERVLRESAEAEERDRHIERVLTSMRDDLRDAETRAEAAEARAREAEGKRAEAEQTGRGTEQRVADAEKRATTAEAAEAAAYKRGFEEGRGKAKDATAPAYVRG